VKVGFAILIILLSVSCVTQRKCLEKFPPDIDSVLTIRDTTIYRDTVISRYLPGDTVYSWRYIFDTVEINTEPELYPPDTAFAETDLALAKAWVDVRGRFSKVNVILIQKDTTLQFRLDSALRASDHWERLYITEVHTVPERFIPLWTKILISALVLIILLILLRGILKN